MAHTLSLFQRVESFGPRTALIDTAGAITYAELLGAASGLAGQLLAGRTDLAEARVAFLVPAGRNYVTTLWGVWLAGGIAVPLSPHHPPPELAYYLDDADVTAVVTSPEFRDALAPLAAARSLRVLKVGPESFVGDVGGTNQPLTPHQSPRGQGEGSKTSPHSPQNRTDAYFPPALPDLAPTRRALIVYTSGTTSRPKGVVTTHANIAAQVECLVSAWEWTPADHILHALPLHHVHGIVNALLCALWSGAVCEMLPRFEAKQVWERLGRGGLTLFMAVPTMYARLIAAWDEMPADEQKRLSAAANQLRLMVSGSAALPVSTLEKWQTVTGHVLLERYGMTEIGMALSNPLHGRRVPGHVGTPLPGVTVRLVDEAGTPVPEGTPGEIEVRGPNVFLEYWRRPEATAAAFRDGWFRSGDAAVVEDGAYRILGRNSVDILKTGGYKVSALEIEETLRTHPAVRECAVVGCPDPDWGDRVAACVVLQPGASLTLPELREWAKERLAAYKVPRQLAVVAELPRNAMGKVVKPDVVALLGKG